MILKGENWILWHFIMSKKEVPEMYWTVVKCNNNYWEIITKTGFTEKKSGYYNVFVTVIL
jgi:hypothetical protein